MDEKSFGLGHDTGIPKVDKGAIHVYLKRSHAKYAAQAEHGG